MSARRGAQFVPIRIPIICWKTCKNHENVVYQTLNHRDDVIFRELVLSRSVPLQSILLRDRKLDICICDYRFLKMKEFRMMLATLLFQFSCLFVEGSIHEFQYQRFSDFLYDYEGKYYDHEF